MNHAIRGVLFSAAILGISGLGITQSPWLVPYGDAGCASDFVPTLHTGGEMPTLGNANFKLTLENLRGGAQGFLALSRSAADLPFLGMRLYIDPSLGLAIGSHAAGMSAVPGSGVAHIPLPLPGDASLVGSKFFLQGLFIDSAFPFSLVTTHGLGIALAQSIAVERAVIRDRLKYQAHFAGVNQAQADTLGAAIWAANQAAGFSYVKTEQFTCGGESHWMVIVLHGQTGMEFCLIPGGSFRMGDINGTYPWPPTFQVNNELPVRRLRIKPFLLARTEVPQSVWQAAMGSNPSRFQGPTLPVEMVSWNDAQAFCGRTGLRLPSEAEWEYACRAGVDNCYHFGVNYVEPGPANLGLYAWYSANSGSRTQPIGGKLPNTFGLFDMHGNVWEWCEDWYPRTGDYKCAPSDGRAWLGGSAFRVYRGGGWGNVAGLCRSSNRGGGPGYRYDALGFRPSSPLR